MIILTNKKVVWIAGIIGALFLFVLSFSIVSAMDTDKKGIPLPVLMYHSVLKSERKESTFVVSEKQLEEDFEYIKKEGYTSVSAGQVIAYVKGEGVLPPKPILITFDDGAYNNYEIAYPLLKKYGYKAVFSIVGEYIDKSTEEDLKDNVNYSQTKWGQLKELASSGVIEVGNHSYSMHSQRKRKGVLRKRREDKGEYASLLTTDLKKLQDETKEKIGVSPRVFAFPFGARNNESQEIIENMGFEMILGCAKGMNYLEPKKTDVLMNLKRVNRDGRRSIEKIFKQFK